MASNGTRSRGSAQRRPQRQRAQEPGLLGELAKAARTVEVAAKRQRPTLAMRATFQAVAMLVREERTRVSADPELSDNRRKEQLKRLDGIGTILATSAAVEPSLFDLLADNAEMTPDARAVRREIEQRAGLEVSEDVAAPTSTPAPETSRKVLPKGVVARQLANPFMAPTVSRPVVVPQTRRLANWDLIDSLLSSFERAPAGAIACMELPDPIELRSGVDLMKHQAKVVAAAAEGHRTFLLADEPGLGKTAQALLAAEAANAYPLLAVVPNVVKVNWARETQLWTPRRRATVIHGDGEDLDAFADVIVVNYDILDRHVGWLGDLGFRGMVVDEAHFIKNKSSQRSQHVLSLAERMRQRVADPLFMALTGTPLINDLDDFRAIWEFLGWIDEKKPRRELMAALEATGLTPMDREFFPAARRAVIDMGIVRRRKVDVAADIPARQIADLPVELAGAAANDIREAEAALVRRLLRRYDAGIKAAQEAGSSIASDAVDTALIRRVARGLREDGGADDSGENIFTMVRRIGVAKAELAADYAAQLARNVGKVVYFAKHIEAMDIAEQTFTARGLKHVSVRGDQTSKARQEAVDSFVNDPEVAVIVCSLTAAGVGLNLQVASNVVLAELSWTDAEQQQAIDRVHRIGQGDPVTAWRVIASQTIDLRIAELVASKAGLAAKALDGADIDLDDPVDIQTEALVSLLTNALAARASA